LPAAAARITKIVVMGDRMSSFPATEADVLALAADWLARGHKVALATVVRASGSAPRQLGSHIVVRDDGAFGGSVSAGCVENAGDRAGPGGAERRPKPHRQFRHQRWDAGAGPAVRRREIEILVEPIV